MQRLQLKAIAFDHVNFKAPALGFGNSAAQYALRICAPDVYLDAIFFFKRCGERIDLFLPHGGIKVQDPFCVRFGQQSLAAVDTF